MIRKLALVLMALIAVPTVSVAGTQSYGPRFGFSVDPDQLLVGGQMVFGDLAPNIVFSPNGELGFGDNQLNIYLDMDFDYRFRLKSSDWVPYAGFGIGIDFRSIDRDAPQSDDSDTLVGGNVILGAAVPTNGGSKFFGELRLGLADMPSLKMIAGWNFAAR